jgi:two-component system, NarL family, response regulator NreC
MMKAEAPQPEVEVLSIVLADDHTVVRSALRMLLEAEDDIEVVAEAGTADDALRYVRGHSPSVLILDLEMPGRPSLEVLPEIVEASPDTGVVILTMRNESEFAREALRSGVRGYVLKEAADAELVQAVRCASAGETYLQPALGVRLAREAPDAANDGLSEREHGILKLIALGHTNAEIADQLFLSIRTVESHRSNLQGKLGLNSRAELVRYALDRGIIGG